MAKPPYRAYVLGLISVLLLVSSAANAESYAVVEEANNNTELNVFLGNENLSFAANYRRVQKGFKPAFIYIASGKIDVLVDHSARIPIARITTKTKSGFLTQYLKKSGAKWRSFQIGFEKYQVHFAVRSRSMACEDQASLASLDSIVNATSSAIVSTLNPGLFNENCKSDQKTFSEMSLAIDSLMRDNDEQLALSKNPEVLKCLLQSSNSFRSQLPLIFKSHRLSAANGVPLTKISCDLKGSELCGMLDESEGAKGKDGRPIIRINLSCITKPGDKVQGLEAFDIGREVRKLYVHEFLHSPPVSLKENDILKLEEENCRIAQNHLFNWNIKGLPTPKEQDAAIHEAREKGNLPSSTEFNEATTPILSTTALESLPTEYFASAKEEAKSKPGSTFARGTYASTKRIAEASVASFAQKMAPYVKFVESPAFAATLDAPTAPLKPLASLVPSSHPQSSKSTSIGSASSVNPVSSTTDSRFKVAAAASGGSEQSASIQSSNDPQEDPDSSGESNQASSAAPASKTLASQSKGKIASHSAGDPVADSSNAGGLNIPRRARPTYRDRQPSSTASFAGTDNRSPKRMQRTELIRDLRSSTPQLLKRRLREDPSFAEEIKKAGISIKFDGFPNIISTNPIEVFEERDGALVPTKDLAK